MEPFFAEFSKHFDSLQESMRKTIHGLPQAALDWSPDLQENSIAVLTAHTAGANVYLLRDVILGQSTGRDREAEFRTQGLDETALLALIEQQQQAFNEAINSLRFDDLQAERINPRTGKPVTVSWALLHVLEHTSLHVGHMELTRKAWQILQG